MVCTLDSSYIQNSDPLIIEKLKNCGDLTASQVTGCTAGEITEATIADPSFPIGYDSTQFDLCLNVTTLTSNVAAITQKVVDIGMERVILNKLNQAYPSGLGDSVLQLLGSTSRVASVSEISSWTITTIDTLSSLMNPDDGTWTSEQSNAIIMVYLSVAGQTLGSAELNAIGSNLCSLNVNLLNTITSDSLSNVNSMNVSSCSIDQKTALYNIAKISFNSERSNVSDYFLLIKSYLGGAPLMDIQALAALNIQMDINTFIGINPNVIMVLSISTVRDLLGVNLPDLKLFENTTVIKSWEEQQYQSQLDTLGIGLTGGKPDHHRTFYYRFYHK
ncbi:mesothelin-like protein [Brachyhypopomus gauderio]|uniref:mesothelin-like protein n=1 Tax=Brachyhypopomus gauderio TaxID=698409 RepID=UPI0040433BEE